MIWSTCQRVFILTLTVQPYAVIEFNKYTNAVPYVIYLILYILNICNWDIGFHFDAVIFDYVESIEYQYAILFWVMNLSL